MSARRLSICLAAAGMSAHNARLQPWRYLGEVAAQLAARGHRLTVVSDCPPSPGTPYQGITTPSVFNYVWQAGTPIQAAIAKLRPDVLLLHLGLTSTLHQRFGWWGSLPAFGIFTSPIYTFAELAQLGVARLYRERGLSAVHLLGSLAPRRLLRRRLRDSRLRGLVVQTQTTRGKLLEASLWDGEIRVIPPGVDSDWRPIPGEGAARRRRELNYVPDDVVAVYFGPPNPLRGVPLLLRAAALARKELPALRLLLLSRQRPGEPERDVVRLKQMLDRDHYGEFTRLVSAFLPTQALARYAAACDLAALPFELVPSDAPLGPLEARALGLPLVTTRLACLPELAEGGRHALAEPGDVDSLAAALLQAAGELCQGRPDEATPAPRPWSAVGEEWEQFLHQQLTSL